MNHQTNRRSNNSRPSPVRNRSEAITEPLEPRRMLAVFNATNGPDTIEIRRGTDGVTHVRINGGATQDTSDLQVVINALGGNDSVYFPELRNFISERRLQLFLGDGNDLASNYDPVTQTASRRTRGGYSA